MEDMAHPNVLVELAPFGALRGGTTATATLPMAVRWNSPLTQSTVVHVIMHVPRDRNAALVAVFLSVINPTTQTGLATLGKRTKTLLRIVNLRLSNRVALTVSAQAEPSRTWQIVPLTAPRLVGTAPVAEVKLQLIVPLTAP